MTVKKWYLIRHGQTNFNKKRCFYGKSDVSINEQGQYESLQIKKIMKNRLVQNIYTSQLRRTQETAQLIFPGREFIICPDLNERDFGLWEGRTADEIESAFPIVWKEWLDNPFIVTPSKAEPFYKFSNRVKEIKEKIQESNLYSVAIIAHLGVLRLIYQYLINSKKDFWSIDVPQGSVLFLENNDTWSESLLKEHVIK